jgi:carbonic anhydrase/acetyltransferase-like protein (isoleucine patch superfamily)
MRTYTLPSKTYRLFFLLLIGSQTLRAQPTNYVANTANSDTPGYTNVLIGPFAGNATMIGSGNIFVGYESGRENTSGAYNTFIGGNSGFHNSTGIDNLFVGYRAGFNNTIGGRNEFFGTEVGMNNTSGQNNTFMGFLVGHQNTTGSANVFMGNQAGYRNTAASSNTFVGDQAGYSNTIGGSNVFIGNLAGYNNINGQANMFLGPQTGSNNQSGNYNVFLGNAAANANTTGSDNTAIGAGSAAQNTTGQRNVFIGEYAGFNSQSGNDNVFIGFGTKAGTVNPTNLNNAVAIGANAIVSQSNSVVLGANANVGVGTSAPKNKLEITQGTANQSGLRLTNLTSASPASLTNQSKFLTVNEQGDVILASLNGSGRLGVSESLWERKGSFLQSLQGEAIIIGSKVGHTPVGYKLFVEDGILTEKVKVAVKNTAEWSDKVFAPSYSLWPLADVEQYISKHQHLPGVPSAQEMVQQGNDLHKTDAKLLEKIEELTLYSIQLEKQLEATKREQQAKIDKLERLVNQLLDKK